MFGFAIIALFAVFQDFGMIPVVKDCLMISWSVFLTLSWAFWIISFEMLSGPGAFLSLSWFIALLILFFEVILSSVA